MTSTELKPLLLTLTFIVQGHKVLDLFKVTWYLTLTFVFKFDLDGNSQCRHDTLVCIIDLDDFMTSG